MGKVTDAALTLGAITLAIAFLLFLCWCALITMSIFTGRNFITSAVIIVGIMVLLELFAYQFRRSPINQSSYKWLKR